MARAVSWSPPEVGLKVQGWGVDRLAGDGGVPRAGALHQRRPRHPWCGRALHGCMHT